MNFTIILSNYKIFPSNWSSSNTNQKQQKNLSNFEKKKNILAITLFYTSGYSNDQFLGTRLE